MKLWDKTKDILVVMGGPSTEAEVSRRTSVGRRRVQSNYA